MILTKRVFGARKEGKLPCVLSYGEVFVLVRSGAGHFFGVLGSGRSISGRVNSTTSLARRRLSKRPEVRLRHRGPIRHVKATQSPIRANWRDFCTDR